MLGFINYIRHDLEGVYTAELLRGSISMLVACILLLVTPSTNASAYMLIIALYGLRSLTPLPLLKRMIHLLFSLILLCSTLIGAIILGQKEQYLLAVIFSTIFSAWTVYLLDRKNHFAGTMMFMSVFMIVNFGMGQTEVAQSITINDLLYSCLLGSSCVLIAALVVPVVNFHWCLLINHCFYHDLKLLCRYILKAPDYGSQYELPLKTRDQLLKLESSLLNILNHVKSPVRQQLYQDLTKGLILIIFWPSAHTDKNHLITVNRLRRKALQNIIDILIYHKNIEPCLEQLSYEKPSTVFDPFCNGEFTKHIDKVVTDALYLSKWEQLNTKKQERI